MRYFYQKADYQGNWAEHYTVDDFENRRLKRYIYNFRIYKVWDTGWMSYFDSELGGAIAESQGSISTTSIEVTEDKFKKGMFVLSL